MLGKLEHGIEIEPREPHLNASVPGNGDFALERRVELQVGVSVNIPRQQFVVQPGQLGFEIGDPAPVSFLLTVKPRLLLLPDSPNFSRELSEEYLVGTNGPQPLAEALLDDRCTASDVPLRTVQIRMAFRHAPGDLLAAFRALQESTEFKIAPGH